MDCSITGLPVLHYPPEFAQTHVHCVIMPSSNLICFCLLLLLPSIYPSLRVFSSESTLPISCPKYWNFSFIISPSSEYSGFISFRIDYFDIFAVQRILKSLLQHHKLKASIFGPSLWSNSYFPTLTAGKTITLTIQTFVGEVMSLLLNMLSRFVKAFLPGSKSLLISWL